MIKTQALIEIEVNEKLYKFYCDNDSKLGDLYEAMRQMMDVIIEKMKQANQRQEEKKDNENA